MGINEAYAASVRARAEAGLRGVSEIGMNQRSVAASRLFSAGRLRCRFSHDQFGFNRYFGRIFFFIFNAFQQALCSDFAHPVERLAEWWRVGGVKGRAP